MSIKKYCAYYIRFAAAFFGLLLLQSGSAQSIRTSVSKKNILIGEQVTYVLQIGLPSPEYTVALNLPDSVPHFDILKKSGGNGKDQQGNSVWQQTIVFTSFDSGSWNFPALSYRINRRNTSSQPLATDTFRINVGYMPLDKSGRPRDIDSLIEVDYFDWFWVWVGAGILLLLILLYLLYRYLKKRNNKIPGDTKIGAYDAALTEITDLRKANQQHSLPVKEFHTQLADVLKNYYSKSVHLNFLSKTTGEILSKLKSHELKAETESQITEALETGDAVKYAKYHSTYTENEAALDYLKNAIEEIERSLSKKI